MISQKHNTLINVSPYVDLPKTLKSYDDRTYRLNIQPLQGGPGWVVSYDSIFHDDIYIKNNDLHEAKRKLAFKINGMIQAKRIKRIVQPDLVWGVFPRDCYGLSKDNVNDLLIKTFEDYGEALKFSQKVGEKSAIHLTTLRKDHNEQKVAA